MGPAQLLHRPILVEQPQRFGGPRVSHEYYTCPLCEQPRKARSFKPLYGQLACSRCRTGLVSARQWAWALDIFSLHMAYTALTYFLTVQGVGVRGADATYAFALAAFLGELLFALAFMSKDGLFAGQSPGKWLMGLRTVRVPQRSPITLAESFRRNIPFIPSLVLSALGASLMVIPEVGAGVLVLGRLAWYATILLLSAQLPKGLRWGDRYAGTKVVPVRQENHPFFTQSPNCEGCGYDLRGSQSASCPECGRPLSEANLAALGRSTPAVG